MTVGGDDAHFDAQGQLRFLGREIANQTPGGLKLLAASSLVLNILLIYLMLVR